MLGIIISTKVRVLFFGMSKFRGLFPAFHPYNYIKLITLKILLWLNANWTIKNYPYFAIKKPTKTGLKLRDYNMTIGYEGALM